MSVLSFGVLGTFINKVFSVSASMSIYKNVNK